MWQIAATETMGEKFLDQCNIDIAVTFLKGFPAEWGEDISCKRRLRCRKSWSEALGQ
jgi:hypothetical protein